mmetsp:Transcript_43630/g.170729  ORF Transcript_43630/g.170729 Transcript_43630/m.170729 type:complete len:92 (+) Transcript_43630:2466-2741(+)
MEGRKPLRILENQPLSSFAPNMHELDLTDSRSLLHLQPNRFDVKRLQSIAEVFRIHLFLVNLLNFLKAFNDKQLRSDALTPSVRALTGRAS